MSLTVMEEPSNQALLFALRIDGQACGEKLTLEQLYSIVQEHLRARPPEREMVIMLINAVGYRYAGYIKPMLFQVHMTTANAMKRYFCHASHGRLFAMCCQPNSGETVSTLLSLSEPCRDHGCPLLPASERA